MGDAPPIVIVERRISRSELRRLVALFFEDMVKYVVDLERGVDRLRDLTFALLGCGEPLP